MNFKVEGNLDKQCAVCAGTSDLGFDVNSETTTVVGTLCRECKLDVQMAEHVFGLPTLGFIKEYLKMTRG